MHVQEIEKISCKATDVIFMHMLLIRVARVARGWRDGLLPVRVALRIMGAYKLEVAP